MYDVFGIRRSMRWVQIAFALLVAFGLIAGLAGMATGRVHREPVARDARPVTGTRRAVRDVPSNLHAGGVKEGLAPFGTDVSSGSPFVSRDATTRPERSGWRYILDCLRGGFDAKAFGNLVSSVPRSPPRVME